MSSEVIVISDGPGNDFPLRKPRRRYESDDSDVQILETNTRNSQLPPSSSIPSSTQEVYDIDGLVIDSSDHEFLDARGFVAQASQTGSKRPSSSSDSDGYSNVSSRAATALKRKSSGYVHLDRETVVAPAKKTAKRRKTVEDKEAEKQQKALDREMKKQETTAKKAAEKAEKQLYKETNKLITKKTDPLVEMAIEVTQNLYDTGLAALVHKLISPFGGNLEIWTEDPWIEHSFTKERTPIDHLTRRGLKILRWQRHVTRLYNEEQREWDPVPPEEQVYRPERTYVIFLSKEEIKGFIFERPICLSPAEQINLLRAALGPKHHIHLITCGKHSIVADKTRRDGFEMELGSLQVRDHMFLTEARDLEDAADRIYNLSADLGNKPNKLIERSHLPFLGLATSSIKCGQDYQDTFRKMLCQPARISEAVADAIADKYGTITNLMEAYLREQNPGRARLLLADLAKKRNKDGRSTDGTIGQAISGRIYELLWINDPKSLLNRGES